VHDDGYFDERVAARYDESAAEMFAPALVDPVIDLLVEIAGSGRARARDRDGQPAVSAPAGP
jgi:hypothetical protein